MRVLVVGANGLLGSNLVKMLCLNHNVYALVNKNKKLNFQLNENIKIIETDLNKLDTNDLPNNIDVVFYLAQSNKFRDFPENTSDVISINILAPNTIAKWAVDSGVKKFIYASSGGVYTGQNKPANENLEINANVNLGFYLSTKLSAEILLKNYEKYFQSFIILRPFFIYGVGQNENMLIPRLISNIKNEKDITLNGKNGLKINPIYVTDASNALLNLLNLNDNLIINLAGEEIVSLRELCVMISEQVGKKPYFKINDIAQNDLVADVTIMKKKLFQPKVNLKSGISKIITSNH